MDASELSERIGNLVRENMLAEAAAEIARARRESATFGKRHCDLPEHPDVYARFATTGYPFRLRRQWTEEDDASGLIELILPHVVEWNLADLGGQPIPLPDGERKAALLDDVDLPLVTWLIRGVSQFILIELVSPRKN